MRISSTIAAVAMLLPLTSALAQPAPEAAAQKIKTRLAELQDAVAKLKQRDGDLRLVADVDVYAKAAQWILRHDEFYKPSYVEQTLAALDTGLKRAAELAAGKPSWTGRVGTSIRGYYSKVDGSVQPYAITLPDGVDRRSGQRWPLHVRLHGRAGQMNEVNFIHRHDGKPLPDDQTWVQIDVFGRTNNAYRWAGETDVFEAMKDVNRTVRIDKRRIVLWGFSMGGAGAWHLGLHHPSQWCSVGPGAGFVDFYKYQNQTQRRPDYQHKALHIYDSIDYVLNAFNVPVCTYGGDQDKQLVASTSMVEKAKSLGVPIKLLIGQDTGHRFHPDSFREFMAFHKANAKKGRAGYPGAREIRFITYTLKYNQCEWLTVEEVIEMYKPAVVVAKVDGNGTLKVKTDNVAVLRISRDVADFAEIDGTFLPLVNAADGLLPGVYYELGSRRWYEMEYETSKNFPNNPDHRKRRDLQGPIDDAFMQPFVCVRGTGTPWSTAHHEWGHWTLDRFAGEFDKWMRGRVPIVDDADVSDELIADKNLVLFGDPGSNAVLARMLDRLPLDWTEKSITIGGTSYDPDTHGLSLIYPNPLNPRRYVVINSGHTFHEADFKASNSWLFPRLGDVAVQEFQKRDGGGYDESVKWAEMFNSAWRLPR